jgi:hypothetical protein
MKKKKMTDAVVNWDSIVHKNVRSKDGEGAGNVDAILGDIIVITSQGDRAEYKLPKSQVEGYNGAEVSLKITLGELEEYRT